MARRKKKPVPVTVYQAPMAPLSIFRNAITESDNRSVNVGYLSLFWIMIVVLNVIPIMVIGAIVQTYYDEHHVFPFAQLGTGVGYVTGAFAAAMAALGAFIWGDSTKDAAAKTTTITATTSTPAGK